MKFRTMYDYDHIKRIESCPGDPIKIEYQLRVKDNEFTLVEVGKTDLNEYIQSHADSVDIHKILERCALANDYSALNKMPAQFMDTEFMPTTLAEAFSQVQDAKNFFDKLPVPVKETFDNNFIEFIGDIGNKRFVDAIKKYNDSVKLKNENNEEKVDES